MSKSKLETLFSNQVKMLKLPVPVQEYKFHSTRKWRFDFAYPDLKLAVEIEGGTWSGGRHTRGAGFENDCIKYGEALLLGWTVYRCTGGMVKSGLAIETLEKLILNEEIKDDK